MDDERIFGAIAVRRAILSCTRCELRMECSSPVAWSGPLDAEIAVVGEAPGRTEDAEQRPFIGVAGRFLRQSLESAGVNPNTVAYINSANCWPSVTKTPKKEHLAACGTHLAGQIKAVRPSMVLSVGVTALNALFPGEKLELRDVRGRPLWLESVSGWKLEKGVTVWPTYHPAARSPTQRLTMKEDLASAFTWYSRKDTFPGTCAKKGCDNELEEFDHIGRAWCADHRGKQGVML